MLETGSSQTVTEAVRSRTVTEAARSRRLWTPKPGSMRTERPGIWSAQLVTAEAALAAPNSGYFAAGQWLPVGWVVRVRCRRAC